MGNSVHTIIADDDVHEADPLPFLVAFIVRTFILLGELPAVFVILE